MILGIDYGKSHLGLATTEGELAEPYGTVQNSGNVKQTLTDLCQKLNIDTIVVGISEGKSAEDAKNFGNELSDVLRLPVKFVDETLSTIEADTGKRKDQGKDHERAAAIILQRYLDMQ